MCGRFALGLPRPVILRAVHDDHPELNLDLDEWIDEGSFQPRFNIAPRSRSPVIRRRNAFDDRSSADEDTEKQAESNSEEKKGESEKEDLEATPIPATVMHTMKWGLVPHWSKHEDTNLNTINAKGEVLTEGGGMWAGIKGRKRCVVVCQGYYEWQKKGKERIPHFTRHKDGKLMLLAGLYDSVTLEGHKEPLYTYTIVTTDANKQLSWLHDRMPLILSSPTQISTWLDTSTQKWTPQLGKIIRPFVSPKKEYDLECYAVPKEVGKVGTESPTFVEPVNKRKDGIEAMFARQSGKARKDEKKGEGKWNKEEEKKKGSSSTLVTKVKPPSTNEVQPPSMTPGKRKRGSSPSWLTKEENREPSVEVLSASPDEPSTPSPKKARRTGGRHKQEEQQPHQEHAVKSKHEPEPANTDEPNLSSQPNITSSPKRKKLAGSSPSTPAKSTKSSKTPSTEHQNTTSPSPSPGNSKITSFFKKG